MDSARQEIMAQLREARMAHDARRDERDELFQLMLGRTTTKAVERILAAGYRKPRTITTVEELDALPDTAVILTKGGIVFRKYDNWFSEDVTAWIRCGVGHDPLTTEGFSYDAWAHFPATVLHEGGAS